MFAGAPVVWRPRYVASKIRAFRNIQYLVIYSELKFNYFPTWIGSVNLRGDCVWQQLSLTRRDGTGGCCFDTDVSIRFPLSSPSNWIIVKYSTVKLATQVCHVFQKYFGDCMLSCPLVLLASWHLRHQHGSVSFFYSSKIPIRSVWYLFESIEGSCVTVSTYLCHLLFPNSPLPRHAGMKRTYRDMGIYSLNSWLDAPP